MPLVPVFSRTASDRVRFPVVLFSIGRMCKQLQLAAKPKSFNSWIHMRSPKP